MQGENVHEFGPLATLIQGAPIDFEIEGPGENYSDLNNTRLEVRAKLSMPEEGGQRIPGGQSLLVSERGARDRQESLPDREGDSHAQIQKGSEGAALQVERLAHKGQHLGS